MSFKITSGIASGISLKTPKTLDVRPTGIRAKKALFDSLSSSFGFEGKVVVDLFAGTGGLGLEAASRGAEKVFLLERSSQHCRLAEENIQQIEKSGVTASIKVFQGDVFSAPSRLEEISGKVDLIFADPPYAKFAFFYKNLLKDAKFAKWGENAVMIWEQPPDFRNDVNKKMSFWQISNLRKFAQTQFIFLTQ